jgi:small subunit ribosomal protein S1
MSDRQENRETFGALFEQSAAASRGRRRFRVGEPLEVTVVVLGRDAVFADLGGKQEGFFERIELTDAQGKLTVSVGSRISAVVAAVDDRAGQVRLTPVFVRSADDTDTRPPAAASVVAAPAGKAAPVLVQGARVKGKVTGIERFGVFVQIAGSTGRTGRGLVPASETGTARGADLKKHFTVGQDVEAKIVAIDEAGKIRLSISALRADEERNEFEAYLAGGAPDDGSAAEVPAAGSASAKGGSKGGSKKNADKPAPRSFGTLGDLLAKAPRKK